MNQDPAAKPARLVAQRTNGTAVTTSSIVTQIFARPLAGGQLAVLLLNRAEAAATLSVSWAELGLPRAQAMAVRHVVGRRDLPPATGSFSARVPPHDVAFVRLRHKKAPVKLDDDAAPRTAGPPPHIFFVLVDDLGHAEVGFNRASPTPEVVTPQIDALVREGVHLTRHYVHYVCTPTRTS